VVTTAREGVREGEDSEARVSELAEYGLPGVAGSAAEHGAAGEARLEDAVASLRRLAYLAAQLCETPSAVINILDAAHQHQVAAFGVDPRVCAVQDSMCVVVLEQRSPVLVPDAAADERFRANPFVTGEFGSLRLYASAPLVNPDGHVLGRLCVFDEKPRELTSTQLKNLQELAGQVVEVLELRRRTLRLARTHAELSRSNQLLSEFAGRLCHDLKSPLTSVVGMAATLPRFATISSDARSLRLVGDIADAAQRMRALVDEMLAFASVGGHTELVPVDLESVMNEVRHDLDTLIGEAHAHVRVDSDTLCADRQQLRVLVQNLVANAITYRRRDRECRVGVRGRQTAHGWTLQVTDNGQGIPDESRGEVLRPLVRLDRDNAISGTGLGLSTCVRVAEAHHGHLTISDTPGGGTTVTVRTPTAPCATTGAARPAPRYQPKGQHHAVAELHPAPEAARWA
jgi:signal transduction histidine kinase